MLAKIGLELSCTSELSYQMSSMFHGALMELLPADYADYLHISQLHPYTQHLETRAGQWFWVVSCLNEEAIEKIIGQTLEKLDSIVLKKKNIAIKIVQKKIEYLSEVQMMKKFYQEDCSKYIQIHFLTPTAFKQQGQYVFYPDIHCIFQSLMAKYDAAVKENQMLDDEALEQLCQNAKIIRYDLKSVNFALEGAKIPSFIGKITIKMRGTQTMANFANLLIKFGTFSGVGIKTSLGMGSYKIQNEGGKRCLQTGKSN